MLKMEKYFLVLLFVVAVSCEIQLDNKCDENIKPIADFNKAKFLETKKWFVLNSTSEISKCSVMTFNESEWVTKHNADETKPSEKVEITWEEGGSFTVVKKVYKIIKFVEKQYVIIHECSNNEETTTTTTTPTTITTTPTTITTTPTTITTTPTTITTTPTTITTTPTTITTTPTTITTTPTTITTALTNPTDPEGGSGEGTGEGNGGETAKKPTGEAIGKSKLATANTWILTVDSQPSATIITDIKNALEEFKDEIKMENMKEIDHADAECSGAWNKALTSLLIIGVIITRLF